MQHFFLIRRSSHLYYLSGPVKDAVIPDPAYIYGLTGGGYGKPKVSMAAG